MIDKVVEEKKILEMALIMNFNIGMALLSEK